MKTDDIFYSEDQTEESSSEDDSFEKLIKKLNK
jgi:hypothetical protein